MTASLLMDWLTEFHSTKLTLAKLVLGLQCLQINSSGPSESSGWPDQSSWQTCPDICCASSFHFPVSSGCIPPPASTCWGGLDACSVIDREDESKTFIQQQSCFFFSGPGFFFIFFQPNGWWCSSFSVHLMGENGDTTLCHTHFRFSE